MAVDYGYFIRGSLPCCLIFLGLVLEPDTPASFTLTRWLSWSLSVASVWSIPGIRSHSSCRAHPCTPEMVIFFGFCMHYFFGERGKSASYRYTRQCCITKTEKTQNIGNNEKQTQIKTDTDTHRQKLVESRFFGFSDSKDFSNLDHRLNRKS